ncbi:alpha/beta hydrolase [Gordonibacter sp. 28C]|uniref:alpha/beta fold hydrolase n=1 Tax=Gordonibacter sp. 28C TaxID=2078569 RepID=UPI000DF7BD66|nr:alpha/beta fold hydrolase [Gordonibacter sp. 28C]RDB58660.1 alpha/beta hydrolase [Gordonibacter sp. 28C]
MKRIAKTSENAAATDAAAPRRRWPRRLAIALAAVAVVAVLVVAAFLVYAGDYYHDADADHENLASTAQIPVHQSASYVAFGDPGAEVGIVFYPGAKVECTAYAPLMRDLAERGYLAVVVEMPFNFAFFNVNAADEVRAAYPQVSCWWVGGHSLGGSMAAQYAADHADDDALAGLVLLGAYTASDLSATDLGAVVVYGSEDRVLNRDKLADSEALMPDGTLIVEIPGGNHAGFGAYGPQSGDGTAAIDPDEQQEQTADVVDAYIARQSSSPLAEAA